MQSDSSTPTESDGPDFDRLRSAVGTIRVAEIRDYPPYPSYKASGVDWLGDIPSNWQVNKLKHVVSTPITDGPHETPIFKDEGIPFVSAEAVATGRIDFSKIRGFISVEDHLKFSLKYCPKKDDIFMVKSGATTGVTAIVDTDTTFNIWSPLAAIRCNSEFVPRYILFFLRSRNFQEGVTLNWSFGTQQNIGMNVIENLQTAKPTLEEQKAIADFLDRETGKLDDLIAEQQTLIEILKEKRQATISHTVTKGLDPNAPTKPSGIDWLGDVPAHWKSEKIKRLGTIRYGIGEPPEYVQQGANLIRATNIHAGKITPEGMVFVDPNSIPVQRIVWLNQGDIIVVRSGAYTGDSAIISEEFSGSIAGFDMVLRTKNCEPMFVQYCLLSDYLKSHQIDLMKMRAAQPHLNAEELGSCTILIPPLKEQKTLVDYLDQETQKIDSLIHEAENAIELLKERRTSLISAAVTGKIDVREAK